MSEQYNLEPDPPRSVDRYSTYGPQTRDVLIAQVKRIQPDFDPVQELSGLDYHEQCDRLCRLCDELEGDVK